MLLIGSDKESRERGLAAQPRTGTLKTIKTMLPVRRNNSWLPEIFNDFFDNSWMERPTYTAPAINVIENEKEYDVELAAPGLNKEDFKIHIDEENNLHIEMEKKNENKEGGRHGRYLRREFSYEKFQQTLLLPDDVNAEKIEAAMENGVLNIRIPKKVKVEKPVTIKQIDVK